MRHNNKTMAAVDRFSFLLKDFSTHYKELFLPDFKSFTPKDWLALLGAGFATYKTVSVLYKLWYVTKVHGLSRLGQPDLVKKYGPWAVVTGSTHGIGQAFAQEFASQGFNVAIISLGEKDCTSMARLLLVTGCTAGLGKAFVTELAATGFNVVLISRSLRKLTDLAAELENTFGVSTLAIPVDFNDGEMVYTRIRDELFGKEVGILVNNVGVMYDYPQMYLDVPEEKLWNLINVNVAAATIITRMLLPDMVDRGYGAVITVSSGSCLKPTPLMTAYSATKAYLAYFMDALSYEYRNSGVTFQCLMPFYVATRMTSFSSSLQNTTLWIPSATDYVRQALQTLGWSPRTSGYFAHTIQAYMISWIPQQLWMWASCRLNQAFQRQARTRIRHRSGEGSRKSSRSTSFTELAGLTSSTSLPKIAENQQRRGSNV